MDTPTVTPESRSGTDRTLPIDHRYLAVGAAVAGVTIAYVAARTGWWSATLATGVLTGLTVQRHRALPIAGVLGAAGWALALLLTGGSIGRIATVTASLAGFGNRTGWVVITATVLLGALLGLLGSWVAVAVLRLLAASLSGADRRAPAGQTDTRQDRPEDLSEEIAAVRVSATQSQPSSSTFPREPALARSGDPSRRETS